MKMLISHILFQLLGKKPLLNELALEWKNNKDNYNFKGIQIVTNKKWGPQETDGKCSMDDFISKVFPCLQDNYNYTSAKLMSRRLSNGTEKIWR